MRLANLTENCYKITLEESWHHERPEVRTQDRIWYEMVSCRGGAFIALYSLEPLTFQLWTPRPKNAKAIWEAVRDGEKVHADFMDGEAVIYFPMEALPTVANLAGAKRRRRLTEEHKAKLREAGKAHRFKNKFYGSNGS
jgi:hypothetical protein